jgi:hypothetical protein
LWGENLDDHSPDVSDSSDYSSYTEQGEGLPFEGLPLRERIVKLIETSEIELTPLQVAQKLHVNHSSVRVYLPQLVAQNRLVTPYKGAYCSQITYGVRFQGLKVHNIVAVGFADFDVHDEVVEVVGSVKVRVVFGIERKKVSIFISCDAGMDKNSCLLALHRGFDIVKCKLGKDLEQIELKTFELNRDYLGVRVDRPTCITRVGLYDMVERVYQKEEGVRHEWKVNKSMSLLEFESLLQGGVSSYNITQANFVLVQEVRKLAEALKYTNAQLLQQSKILESLLNWIYKNGDKK